MRLSSLKKELRNKTSWALFFFSPIFILLVYLGSSILGWNSDTNVNRIVAFLIDSRYSAENSFVILFLSLVLALTSIGLVYVYRRRLPRNERTAILGWFIVAQRLFSATFYFWSGAYVALWLAAKLMPFFSTVPDALLLAALCFLISFIVACYSRDLKVVVANG